MARRFPSSCVRHDSATKIRSCDTPSGSFDDRLGAMGIMDNAKDALGNAGDMVDKAKDAVEEHGDKLPGGVGDKAKDALDKAEGLTDKIPGQGE